MNPAAFVAQIGAVDAFRVTRYNSLREETYNPVFCSGSGAELLNCSNFYPSECAVRTVNLFNVWRMLTAACERIWNSHKVFQTIVKDSNNTKRRCCMCSKFISLIEDKASLYLTLSIAVINRGVREDRTNLCPSRSGNMLD